MINICICGGGSLGHTIAGFVASQKNYNVSVLTRSPHRWSKSIEITDLKIFEEPFIPEGIAAPQSYKYIEYDL